MGKHCCGYVFVDNAKFHPVNSLYVNQLYHISIKFGFEVICCRCYGSAVSSQRNSWTRSILSVLSV